MSTNSLALQNRGRQQKSREQLEKMKAKAVELHRRLGDEDKAGEFEEMSVEDYAERKRVELVNPSQRRAIIEGVLSKLPPGAGTEDRLRAIQAARKVISQCGPDATELDILRAATEGVLSVAVACQRRLRKERCLLDLRYSLPSGTVEAEKREAVKIVCEALEDLPLETSRSKVTARVDEGLAPLIEQIQQRLKVDRLIAAGKTDVESILRDLRSQGLSTAEERFDSGLRRELDAAVTAELEGTHWQRKPRGS